MKTKRNQIKLHRITLFFLILLFGINDSFAEGTWKGSYYCKSNDQKIEVTGTHLYIGVAHFKLMPNSNGSFFKHKEDMVIIMPIEGDDSAVQFLFFREEEFKYNMRNNSTKYEPIANMACERT
jgi:hypothetical protein